MYAKCSSGWSLFKWLLSVSRCGQLPFIVLSSELWEEVVCHLSWASFQLPIILWNHPHCKNHIPACSGHFGRVGCSPFKWWAQKDFKSNKATMHSTCLLFWPDWQLIWFETHPEGVPKSQLMHCKRCWGNGENPDELRYAKAIAQDLLNVGWSIFGRRFIAKNKGGGLHHRAGMYEVPTHTNSRMDMYKSINTYNLFENHSEKGRWRSQLDYFCSDFHVKSTELPISAERGSRGDLRKRGCPDKVSQARWGHLLFGNVQLGPLASILSWKYLKSQVVQTHVYRDIYMHTYTVFQFNYNLQSTSKYIIYS